MLPLLYESTTPILQSNNMHFLGRLTKCQKCSASEKLNGDYTLSAVFSPTDELIDEIQNQRFLLVKANPFDPPQYFEIYKCSIDENGKLSLNARHIKHCCYNNVVIPDNSNGAQYDTPQGHWDFCTYIESASVRSLEFDNYFSFSSAITEQKEIEIGYTKSDTLGAFLQEMARSFGAEFHYDNFNIYLLATRGNKKNFVLRWNKNIGSPNLSLGADNIYTHVVAYADFTAKYRIDGVDYEYPIQVCSRPRLISDFASGASGQLYKILMYNATNLFEETTVDPTDGTFYTNTKAKLAWAAAKYITMSTREELQISENVNLKINYRPRLDEMQELGLGDTVDVMLKGGRTVEARITKTEFDSLAERWNSIELGYEKMKLSNYIAKTR